MSKPLDARTGITNPLGKCTESVETQIPTALMDALTVMQHIEGKGRSEILRDMLTTYLLGSVATFPKQEIDEVQSAFSSYFPKHSFTPTFRESVRRFIKDLHVVEVVHAMNSACMKIKDADRCAKYFCGICWSKIKERR